MALPARRPRIAEDVPEDVPVYDPRAIDRTLREQRARRFARLAHKRAKRNAHIRFFVVILALLGLALFVGLVVWHQIQRLFGL